MTGLPALAFGLLCAACLVAMGTFAWRRRALGAAWPFALFNFALAGFLLLSALRAWQGLPAAAQPVLQPLRAMVGACAPVPLLLFALEACGRGALARRLRPAVVAWPSLHAVLMLAASVAAASGAPLAAAAPLGHGTGHPRVDFLNLGVGAALVVLAVLTLFAHAARSRGRTRARAAWLLFAMLVGAVGPLLDSQVLHSGMVVVTPPALLLECVLFGYAIHRFGVLGALPVAHAQVVREIDAGIVLTDSDNRVIEANRQAVQWLALPHGAIRHRALAELGEAAARVAALEPGQRGVPLAWLVEGRHNAFEIACQPVHGGYGIASGRLYLLADVSVRRQAEQVVEQSMRELDQLVAEQTGELARMTANLAEGNRELARTTRLLAEAQRLARIGSWTWELRDGRLRGSPELQMLLGRDRIVSDFGLEEFAACLHPDDVAEVRRAAAEIGSAGHRQPLVVRALRPDGSLRWLRLHAARVLERDAAGSATMALGTAQDVSAARELEQRLERRGEELERRVAARSRELLGLSRDQDDVNRLAVAALAPALARVEALLGELREREPSAPPELDNALRRIAAAVLRMRAVATEARALADAAARQLRDP